MGEKLGSCHKGGGGGTAFKKLKYKDIYGGVCAPRDIYILKMIKTGNAHTPGNSHRKIYKSQSESGFFWRFSIIYAPIHFQKLIKIIHGEAGEVRGTLFNNERPR